MAAIGTPATALVQRAGVAFTLHEYVLPERHGRARDDRPDYGVEAATALGVEPGRVCKTLIAVLEPGGRLVAAVLSVDRQLDPRRLAAAAGARRSDLADPTVAERATGSVVGGISPLAPRRRLDVVVDVAAMEHATILVSAGRRGLQLELAPADLVRLCNAKVAPVTRVDPESPT
ncbi:MAG: YbaK/EbsC family protein [Candidatus Limnocylindrales bacterium]